MAADAGVILGHVAPIVPAFAGAWVRRARRLSAPAARLAPGPGGLPAIGMAQVQSASMVGGVAAAAPG